MTFRNPLGQFAGSYWASLSRNQKQMLVFMFMLAFVPVAHFMIEGAKKITIVKELHAVNVAEAAVIEPDFAALKIDEMKADVLDRLTKCENPQHKPIVFDTNGKASVGDFQWQTASFQHYWLKKTGEKLSETQAVVYALDHEKARALASYVIFETPNGSGKDWVNCTAWHGLDTLVDFIKAHE